MAGRCRDNVTMPCSACSTTPECACQELVDLDVNHLRFSRPYTVRIHGKGRKERTCPLWKETLAALKAYIGKRGVRLDDATPLFVNCAGNRLTRFGVSYIIAHHVAEAAKICPSLLTRKVTPHTMASHHRDAPASVQR